MSNSGDWQRSKNKSLEEVVQAAQGAASVPATVLQEPVVEEVPGTKLVRRDQRPFQTAGELQHDPFRRRCLSQMIRPSILAASLATSSVGPSASQMRRSNL